MREEMQRLAIAREAASALRARMSALLDAAQRDYPDKPGDDPFWLPAHLGGTAPTPEAAAAKDGSTTSR